MQLQEVQNALSTSFRDQTTLDGTYPSSMTKDEAYAAIHAKYDDIYGAGNVVVVC